MALVNRSFSVNVTPGMMPPIIHVSEYDVGRAYTVSILDEQGNTFTIPSGTTASIEGTLNGSVGFTQSATISNNQVSFTLSESMTAYSGKAWCKIKLTLNSQPIQTCAFILAVDRAGVEADTVIGAPGFQEQINQGVAEYFDNDPPFFELPSGGQSGQALISDGEGGAAWGEAGIPDAVKAALIACFQNVAWKDNQSGQIYIDALEEALADEEITPTPPSDIINPGTLALNNIVDNMYIDENGDVQSYNRSYYNNEYFSISPDATYELLCNSSNFRISEYDAGKTFIRQTQYKNKNNKKILFVSSDRTRFIVFGWYSESSSANAPTVSLTNGVVTQILPMYIGDVNSTTGEDNPNEKRRIHSDFIAMNNAVSVIGWPFGDSVVNYFGYLFRCYDNNKSFIGSVTDNGQLISNDISDAPFPSGTAFVKLVYQFQSTNVESGWDQNVVNPVVINNKTYILTEASS